MKVSSLFLVGIMIISGMVILIASDSFAQRYPDHPITLVIPNAAGGNMDIAARVLAGELEKILGAKIVPTNKPGAATALGTDAVIKGKKDGYTLLYTGASSFVYVPISNPEVVHYDPFKDVEPLGFHFFFPQTITVRADSPWKTFRDLIDYGKKNPAKIRFSTTGVGSSPHFIIEMIQSMTGAAFTHVPFEGGESVITAVLGGHVEATCDSLPKLRAHVDAGKMRILLMTNKMPGFPEVPTITELGYKQTLPTPWFALYAAAGIPEEAKKALVPAIEKAVKNTKPKIDQMGNLCEYRPPAELRKLMQDEYKQIYEIAVKIGLRK